MGAAAILTHACHVTNFVYIGWHVNLVCGHSEPRGWRIQRYVDNIMYYNRVMCAKRRGSFADSKERGYNV